MNGEEYIGVNGFGAHMQLDSKNLEINIGGNFSDAWVLPPALLQLQECGEAELVEELMDIFQIDTAERLELLGRAVESGNYSTAGQEAHTIKGSALQVGAVRVADVCRQMELEARKPQPADLRPLFRALLTNFDEVRGVMAERRPAAPDGSLQHGQ